MEIFGVILTGYNKNKVEVTKLKLDSLDRLNYKGVYLFTTNEKAESFKKAYQDLINALEECYDNWEKSEKWQSYFKRNILDLCTHISDFEFATKHFTENQDYYYSFDSKTYSGNPQSPDKLNELANELFERKNNS